LLMAGRSFARALLGCRMAFLSPFMGVSLELLRALGRARAWTVHTPAPRTGMRTGIGPRINAARVELPSGRASEREIAAAGGGQFVAQDVLGAGSALAAVARDAEPLAQFL